MVTPADEPTGPAPGTDRPIVVLIGPPGSGKSSTGRRVAARLGATFLDTDEAVETSQGRSISDIFVDEGEAAFRDLERRAVLSALTHERGVVSLGGGAPMTPAIAEALTGHTVVLLDVGIADAARRIGFDTSRPLLSVNPRASWIAMMNARRPRYESLATHRVDTSGRRPAKVADDIVALLGLEVVPGFAESADTEAADAEAGGES
ncbi:MULTISPECIES: shikimate kinase [unclassified Janibacter]|uniref:shikimate kinase n=1 Tax=unclassified Janibacter TaxID=2649294 RepID=UPI003D087143